MAVRFELGDPDRPRGHALVYFRTTEGDLLATYVVVLPIAINPAKYIPPALAPRMPQEVSPMSAAALPPIPEQMGDLEEVRHLANLRGDDLLDGGVVTADPERLMMAAHEVATDYASSYRQMVDSLPAPAPGGSSGPAPEADEDELGWVLLDEKQRIGELAKLTGQLRYAVDGGDSHLVKSTTAQMDRLGRHLPDKYRIGEFVVAAQRPGDLGRRLAELYIDRCYKLSNEQYETLADLDREISDLERA